MSLGAIIWWAGAVLCLAFSRRADRLARDARAFYLRGQIEHQRAAKMRDEARALAAEARLDYERARAHVGEHNA